MTMQDCYAVLGGDYSDVFARFQSDRLVQKFVLKYPDDRSFDLLCSAMEKKDYEEAFRAAHTIKGMCQNLSFTKLLNSSSQLSDALRNGRISDAYRLMEQVKKDHLAAISAIKTFREESEKK